MFFQFRLEKIIGICLISAATILFSGGAADGQVDPFGGLTTTGSISISISNANGVKTTKVNDNGRKFTIIESEADGITVKMTKHYGPEDHEKLQQDYPDLFMHIQSFPTETEGATVELNINILTEHTAQNVEELKKDHAEAFKVYEKYTKRGVGGGPAIRRLRRAVPLPEDPFSPDDEKKEEDIDI